MSRRGGGRQPSQSPVPSFQRGGGPGGGDRGRGGGGRGRGGGGRARGGGGGGRARGDGSGRGDSSGLQPADYPPVSSLPPATAPLTEASTNPPISRAPVVAVAPPPKASSSSTPPFKIAEEPASASTSASTLSREVESLALAASQLPPASAKAVRFPARPGLGTVGKKIMVRANHFLVQVADKDLHHYDVSISPEITSKKINRDVMTKLVELYQQSHLGGRYPAYDGRKSLYTAGPLPFISKEFVVKLEDNKSAGSSSSMRREREFKVAIKLVAKVDLHHLQQFLCRRQMDAPQETIQLLDVVLRAKPSEEYTVVGRSFFSHRLGQRGELGDGVEYWGGFYQSLRPTQMGLSLNIDLSARAFYEPLLVTDFITKYMNVRELSRPLSDRDRLAVRKVLRSIKVELSHSGCAKSYKITGISVQPLSQLTFTLEDSTTRMSVVQYFRQKYDIKLKYTHLPALQAGSESKPVFLPMELCQISEGQRYTKKLNERQVTNLLRATCQRPQNREMNIKEMVRKNKYNEDIRVNEFGINVLNELALVDARVLPPPRLKYHDTGREASVDPWLGQWNMINKKMINGGRVDNWTCVNFSSRLEKGLPSEFCKQLIQMCISKGMAFNSMPMLPIFSAHPSQIEKALVDIHKQCIDKRAQLQLLIIILPDVTGSYGKIKRICETELGIVSQCCQPRQASRLNKQYFENVALKINVKVGGRNTVLNDAIHRRIPLVSDLPTIIFGADVTHPQPGEDSSPSIAAVVASMDWPEITKYRGLVSAQPHREEIIQDLYKQTRDPDKGLVHTGMVRDLLKAFFKSTGLKPHRIIFYRDGVSEGQFSQVLLYEMDAIRKACNSIQDGYLPPVTFVVVQKRHHTRLFPADHRNRDLTDKSGNIQPGTVVDTKICHPSEFDFYLNSHAGIQGTSRPTHYHVLYDENNFTADQLQVLTNNLCYTYARCTRSVSIVPPAYYAHLAAYRARYYIEGDVSDAESTSGNRSGNVRALPVIKENVKDVMFYC